MTLTRQLAFEQVLCSTGTQFINESKDLELAYENGDEFIPDHIIIFQPFEYHSLDSLMEVVSTFEYAFTEVCKNWLTNFKAELVKDAMKDKIPSDLNELDISQYFDRINLVNQSS